jgi:hypothetical protein
MYKGMRKTSVTLWKIFLKKIAKNLAKSRVIYYNNQCCDIDSVEA